MRRDSGRRRAGTDVAATAGAILLACAAWVAHPSDAAALDSCSGTFSATSLGDVPRPLIVSIDVPDDLPRNLSLAQHFTTGLRSTGVQVGGQATAIMSVDARFSSQEIGGDAGSFSGNQDQGAGGVQRNYPDAGPLGGGGRVGPQTLFLRAELRAPTTTDAVWYAVIQCQVQTGDVAQLAYDMGTVVGPLIGKRRERTDF